jgi:TNF(Tumour Necrosis Factor) family
MVCNQQLYENVHKSLAQTINYAYYFVNYYTGLSTDDITVLNDWSLSADTAHRSNCIGNGSFHGSIRVDTPGIYSIYSLLQFRRSHSYVQRLMIKSADSPNKILAEDSNYSGTCAPGDNLCEPVYSSALFATVRLTSRDEIWIEAKPYDRLHTMNRHCYWGLFQLAA